MVVHLQSVTSRCVHTPYSLIVRLSYYSYIRMDNILFTSITTRCFTRRNDHCFVGVSEGGVVPDQQMLDDTIEVLEKIGRGDQSLVLELDTRPIAEASVLKLLRFGDTGLGGGYYRLCNYYGKVLKHKVWLCDMPLFIFGDMPEKIYLKRIHGPVCFKKAVLNNDR
jgi:hypothetical protein